VTQTGGGGYVANPDVPLAELVDFDSLLIEADVPEAKLNAIKIDAPCEVVLDCRARSSHARGGRRGQPQAQSRQGHGYGEGQNRRRDRRVLPEMSARVSFLDKPLDANQLAQAAKPVVPSSAIVERGGNKVVFTVDGDRVRIQPVQLGGICQRLRVEERPCTGTVLVKTPCPRSPTDKR